MQSKFGFLQIGKVAADLALAACVEVANALGWDAKEHHSEAEYQILMSVAEERAEEFRLSISDASKRPSFVAVRQATRDCIFFGEGYRAYEKDRAWFSGNRN